MPVKGFNPSCVRPGQFRGFPRPLCDSFGAISRLRWTGQSPVWANRKTRPVQIVVVENATVGGLDGEDPKEIGVDEERAGEFGAVMHLNAHFSAEVAAYGFEYLAVVADIHEITAGEPRNGMASFLGICRDRDNPVRVRITKRRK